MAAAVGGGAHVPGRRRGVRQAVRQRDDPRHPDGEVSIKLPAPLAHLANARHGRYTLTARVGFAHRGAEWRDRIAANRAVAYRIHHDTERGRWYLTASWQRAAVPTMPLEAARARGVVGVDMNDDHLAAWRLDGHGNPVGEPQRFFYDLSGSAEHRDAQIRHALTRLLHWARRVRRRRDRRRGPRLHRRTRPGRSTAAASGSGG